MFKNNIKELSKKVSAIVDNISIPIPTTKIAITGLSRSGKTIFITSLIEQLLLQKKITPITAKKQAFNVTIKSPTTSIKRFDYYSLKKIIKEYHQWPDGTDDITSTTLEFETKSRYRFLNNSKFRIELIDYPGEWILDIAMLGLSYEQWSEKTINWMKNIDEEIVTDYLNSIHELSDKSKGEGIENNIHQQYSKMLSFLKNNHYSNLAPGRFLMPSDLAHDPILCFAPINQSNSPLHQIFKERYEHYLENIVKNIQLEHFRGFDRQIVLIDIIEALQNGHNCYSDMKDGLRSMMSLYDHKNKNFISQWFSSSIRKVTFVATKADLITSSQHKNYSALLNEMVDDIRKKMDINHIKTDTHIISSIKCTETVIREHNGKNLSCIQGISLKEKKKIVLYPGEMPHSFPSPQEWDTKAYNYEIFLPSNISYKDNIPFDHINMDKVVNSLIGEFL